VKILITGGLGFVGSHIVNRFIDAKYDVVILDNRGHTSCLNRVNIKKYNPKIIVGNIQDESVYENLDSDFDLVINSAAETHVDESFERPTDFIDTNILGIHHLSKFCIKTKTPLLHLSTDEVIGNGKPLYENSMTLPTNPYSATKASGESILHAYGYCYGLDWKVVRLNNTYGTMQFPDKLIPYFISKLQDNKKLPIHGSGKQVRFFLNIDDFVDAVEVVMDKGVNKNIYNVSTDESYTVLEVTKMICDDMGEDFNDCVEYVDDRLFQDPIYLSNSDKLRSLGWLPTRTLKQTLPKLIDWYTSKDNFFNE
jgi:dTDP-glucose 4,6-dehydratase